MSLAERINFSFMNVLSSIFLGVIQGLTEFIPVSSSGHLVIAQSLIPNFYQPGILFDVVLHFGTLFAVVYFFRKTLLSINFKYLLLLFIGTLPAVFAGLFFRSQLEASFSAVKWVGIELIITGILNYFVDRTPERNNNITNSNSFLIGIAQAIAIIPGISRSGSTIFTAVKLGIEKKRAAEFSFLLSIPAILGANVLEILTHRGGEGISFGAYFGGFLSAFIVGYLSIRVVMKFLLEKKFKIFAYYCFAIGIVAALFL